MIYTEIHRKKKIEAVRALTDLVERGFEIVVPLKQVRSNSAIRNQYNYKYARYEGVEDCGSLIWYAKLRGDDR